MTRALMLALLMLVAACSWFVADVDTRAKPPLPVGRQVHVLPQSVAPTVTATVEVSE